MTTRTRDPGVPTDYDPSQFPAFAVTVDVVILTMSEGRLHVLLVRRGEAPFEGMWAIPGGFKRPDGDAGRGGEAGAARGDRRRCREPADPVRRLRRPRARPAHERRDGRLPRGASRRRRRRRRARTPRTPLSSRCPTCSNGKIELAFDHQRIVRDAIERVRVELEVSGHRDGVRRSDVHPGRAAGGVRGRLGRAARRRELPAERRRGGGLGDPDRAPSPARRDRRQARRALSRGRVWSHGGPIRRTQPNESRKGAS